MGLHEQLFYKNSLIAEEAKKRAKAVELSVNVIEKSPLSSIKGLGKNAINSLIAAGVDSIELLRSTPEDKLRAILNPIGLKQVKSYLSENDVPRNS